MLPFALLLGALPLLGGCSVDVSIGGIARCDGVFQGSEVTVDDLFDEDGDGWFDGNNPDCLATYALTDCDDIDPLIKPGATEATCNDLDDDCGPATPDAIDGTPGNPEVCDGDDNDCDGGPDFDLDGETDCGGGPATPMSGRWTCPCRTPAPPAPSC